MRTRGVRALTVVAGVGALVVSAVSPASGHDVDETSLPLGETVTEPTIGGLFSCRTDYDPSAGGAAGTGPWFNGDGTWDATKKVAVSGSVDWPDARLEIEKRGDVRVVTGNDLPVFHPTGVFPVASGDAAYAYDRNPNTISAQEVEIEIPLEPEVAASPTCVGGEVGILKSGVALFNAVDALGRDAVAYEVQDGCNGHPQVSGVYHYHSVSECVLEELDGSRGHSKLVGWAFDGFGIYGPRGKGGEALGSDDLDECHGHTHTVRFNGTRQRIYHYHATPDYPYSVGCYRGTPATVQPTGGAAGPGGPGGQASPG